MSGWHAGKQVCHPFLTESGKSLLQLCRTISDWLLLTLKKTEYFKNIRKYMQLK